MAKYSIMVEASFYRLISVEEEAETPAEAVRLAINEIDREIDREDFSKSRCIACEICDEKGRPLASIGTPSKMEGFESFGDGILNDICAQNAAMHEAKDIAELMPLDEAEQKQQKRI